MKSTDVIECSFLQQSLKHFFADKYVKMKLLKDLYTVLCRI